MDIAAFLEHSVYFYDKASLSMSDISVVPLAAPLIAGPGTITAAISLSASIGIARTLPALTMALLVNLLLMVFTGVAEWLRQLSASSGATP